VSRIRHCVRNNCGFRIWWLDLLDVYITIRVQYNSSFNSFLTTPVWRVSHQSLTAVWIADSPVGLKPASRVESYVTTEGQSASLSWNKAAIWNLWPDFYYCQTVAGLLMRGTLSEVRAGLSFKIAAGTRQRSHSRVGIPWDSQPYFTVSDSKLSFSSSPRTRRATMEVLDPRLHVSFYGPVRTTNRTHNWTLRRL
jgi:hypothetical protein